MSITMVKHPRYQSSIKEWEKWRAVYDGKSQYVESYLEQFSSRETAADFAIRKRITPTPNFAKAAVNDIRNSIFQRLTDVHRREGSKTYQDAIAGHGLGVDREGASMNSFLGRKILGELLVMSKVGIFVDMPEIRGKTLRDSIGISPYFYRYLAEDILAWKFRPDDPDELQSVLLRDYVEIEDGVLHLPTAVKTRYRHVFIHEDGKVHVQFYEEETKKPDELSITPDLRIESQQVDIKGNKTNEDIVLDMKSIPFVIIELSDSILGDVANHQIALLNLESSDMNYALKSNFPFYIEQDNDKSFSHFNRKSGPADTGTADEADDSKSKEITVGATQGRRYAPNMDPPNFIHPSPEPLMASIAKQEGLKADIRSLVNLTLSNIQPKMASAESKGMDEKGLEAGLSSIGLELEHAERKLARYWHDLEKSNETASIKYPEKWSLKSDADRREDATALRELRDTIPSGTFQKGISKEIALLLLGSKISDSEIKKIISEIDGAESYTADPETIYRGVEIGLISLKHAAKILGLPEDIVAQAAEEHAERLARILESQGGAEDAAARGVPDADPNPLSGEDEKTKSQQNVNDPTPSKKIRGDGKEEATL